MDKSRQFISEDASRLMEALSLSPSSSEDATRDLEIRTVDLKKKVAGVSDDEGNNLLRE